MAPIPVKRVVSVSSEDGQNPSSNLLRGGSGRKWLTAREKRARRAEVVLELCKKTRINSLEIGNFGSAFIEIHCSTAPPSAGGSDGPSSLEWLTLLPSCMLMTVHDSRAGRNKTSSLTCSAERLSATAVGSKWNHVKIVCRQPYNASAQFGLQYVTFYSEHTTTDVPLTPSPLHTSHHSHPSPLHSTHPPETTPHRNKHKFPSLPPSTVTPNKQGEPKTPHHKSSKTPKRPLREPDADKEGEEFSGVEKQSRLLKNALKGTNGRLNPILERIASEREKAKKETEKGCFESSYEKKRLLVRELERAEGKSDFASGYASSSGKSVEMSAAFRRILRHDNGYEIGQEPEWGSGGGRRRKRRGRRPSGEDGWVKRRKKKLSGMISDCRRVLSEAGTAGCTSGRPEDLSATDDTTTTPDKPGHTVDTAVSEGASECASDSDSDATIIMDYQEEEQPSSHSPSLPIPLAPSHSPLLPIPQLAPSHSPSLPIPLAPSRSPSLPTPQLASIHCPLCGLPFPAYAIELHAASCGDCIATNTDSPLIII